MAAPHSHRSLLPSEAEVDGKVLLLSGSNNTVASHMHPDLFSRNKKLYQDKMCSRVVAVAISNAPHLHACSSSFKP